MWIGDEVVVGEVGGDARGRERGRREKHAFWWGMFII